MNQQDLSQEEVTQLFDDTHFDYDSNVNILDAENKILLHKNIIQKELFKILTRIRMYFKKKKLLENHTNLSQFYSLIQNLEKSKKKYVILYQKYLDVLQQQLEQLVFQNKNISSLTNNSDIREIETSLSQLRRILNDLQQINDKEISQLSIENNLLPIKYIYQIDVFITKAISNDINLVTVINRLSKKIFQVNTTSENEYQEKLHQIFENVKKSKDSIHMLTG